VDNAETLLDSSDLVFVDIIGSGYSQAIAPYTNQSFWSVDQDAAAFRDFVRRYLEVNQRQDSPKLLFGESYGTPRSAVLANLLESAGVTVDGVVLQSSILNYNSNCAMRRTDTVSCEGYLPTYAAVGAYYQLTQPAQPDLPAYMQQMRSFSATSYHPAVQAWLAGTGTPQESMLTQLSDLTGMAPYVWRYLFNLGPGSVQVGMIPGTLLGRYDARINAPSNSPLASEGDPSSTLITPAFTNAWNSYLAGQLKYSANSSYTVMSKAINTWDFRHDNLALPDTVPDLAAALLQNPALQVLSLNGYHDLATPFYQTEMDLARLGRLPNIRIRTFPGGHMNYLDDNSRKQARAELTTFYADLTAAHNARANH
jgi:carboxypeptidase C (cathepsin A)